MATNSITVSQLRCFIITVKLASSKTKLHILKKSAAQNKDNKLNQSSSIYFRNRTMRLTLTGWRSLEASHSIFSLFYLSSPFSRQKLTMVQSDKIRTSTHVTFCLKTFILLPSNNSCCLNPLLNSLNSSLISRPRFSFLIVFAKYLVVLVGYYPNFHIRHTEPVWCHHGPIKKFESVPHLR